MSGQLVQALGLASAGITVAATGAALLVVSLVMSSSLAREIEDDLTQSRRC